MKYGVCAPVGCYGNHLRWLILLSREFVLDFGMSRQDFLRKQIYPDWKCGVGWLEREHMFRPKIEGFVKFNHNIEEMVVLDEPIKIVVLTMRPKYAVKAYVKFNPCLNGHSVKSFMRHVQRDNVSNLGYRNSNVQTIDLDARILYNETLDESFYSKVVDFIGVENRYEIASNIHRMWYNLHVKAEKELLTGLVNINKIYGKI